MKPLFIDDWPNVKQDHDLLSNKIIDVFNEFQKKKIKSKELMDLTNSSSKDHIISLLGKEEPIIRKKSIELQKN